MSTPTCFKDLEFDLPYALLKQLTELFESLPQGPLNEQTVRTVPEAQGVYQLFLDSKLIYVGKTDAEAGLQKRLLRHSRKIQSRCNLNHQTITFKAIRVYVFTAMDLEELLIKHYKGVDTPLDWNSSGFGSNDPGRQRDTTQLKAGHFDKLYPIDMDIEVDVDAVPRPLSVAGLLQHMKGELAYTIRFQNAGGSSRRPHSDLVTAIVDLSGLQMLSVKNLLQRTKAVLGAHWQITALPGYVIIYKEGKHYPEGSVIEAAP